MKIPFFLLGSLLLLTPISRADDNQIFIEAENPVDIQGSFLKQSGKASGGAYLLIPWDGNKSGHATYKFEVKKPGTYFLWARTYWTPNQGNSLHVAVGGKDQILGEDSTYSQWHWVGGRAVTLKAGENFLALIYREAGVRIDQFLLTQQDSGYSAPPRKVTRQTPSNG